MKRFLLLLMILTVTSSVLPLAAGAEQEIVFRMDQVYESETEGVIHYNLYVPDSYDGSVPYALYVALPGWGGLAAREADIMNWLFSQRKEPP